MKTIWMTTIAVSALLALPAYALNPQPEPPGKNKVSKTAAGMSMNRGNAMMNAHVAPGAAQGFNPQPDPPGKTAHALYSTSPVSAVGQQEVHQGAKTGTSQGGLRSLPSTVEDGDSNTVDNKMSVHAGASSSASSSGGGAASANCVAANNMGSMHMSSNTMSAKTGASAHCNAKTNAMGGSGGSSKTH